ALVQQMRELLAWVRGQSLAIVVLSSDPIDIESDMSSHDLPLPDLHLTRDDVPGQKAKGSPVWVEEARERLSLQSGPLLYVGDDERDWRTAINSATFFLHAAWAKEHGPYSCYVVAEPREVQGFLAHFLLPPPRWEYSLDIPEVDLHVRSLLGAGTVLPSTSPGRTFKLQD